MRKTHRIWIILLAVLLLAALFGCRRSESGAAAGGEAIEFDFSASVDGVPTGWSVNSYEGGYTMRSEGGAAGFSVGGYDDCRLCRTVAVEPETRYVLTADVRTEGVEDGQGATLSIDNYSVDGSFVYSEALFGTNDWTTVSLAFRTGASQQSVTVALRLGGYSAESTGSVWFRNVRMEQTDNAPVAFQNLVPYEAGEAEDDRTAEDFENIFTVIFWAGAIAAIVLLFGCAPKGKSLSADREPIPHKYLRFALIVAVGLVVRFILCAKLKGHSTDIVCWKAWGSLIAQGGTRAFYVNNWCDYPPGYMLVCAVLYRIASLFPEGALQTFVYMIPAFLCDVLSGWLIINRARRFDLGDKLALFLAALIVLNPAAVYLSGAWGQIDSILTVMLIGTFMLLNESREKPYYRLYAGILYGAAILMKWQALIFGPVLALLYLMTGIDQWNTKRFSAHVFWSVAAVVGALGVLLLGSLLFKGDGMHILWMIDRYKSASGGYDYASIEAYNYLTLFGGNWAGANNALFGGASVGNMLLRVNELFSKVALLIGFPTLILRAWNEMRTRTDRQKNRAFFELLAAGIVTALLAFLRFLAKNFTSESAGVSGVLKAIGAFPMYGVLMLVLFGIVVQRERDGKKLSAWIVEGGVTAVGAATLFVAACLFGMTFLLAAFWKLLGRTLTWHMFGVIGIIAAGLLTLMLFIVYWERHRAARHSIYRNRGLIFLLAACFCVWVFTLGHYMHERYIFPALFFLVFAYAYDRDPHKLYALCMLTVTTFMNEMMAMFVVSDGAIDLIRGGTVHNAMIALISLLEIGAACYLSAIAFLRALRFDPGDPRGETAEEDKAQKPRKKGGRR